MVTFFLKACICKILIQNLLMVYYRVFFNRDLAFAECLNRVKKPVISGHISQVFNHS